MNCSNSANDDLKSPKRVAAGRRNWSKRKGLTPEGRGRLRQTAEKYQPWLQSTGPKTAAGKRRAAQNGRRGQTGERSTREIRAELTGVADLIKQMRDARLS